VVDGCIDIKDPHGALVLADSLHILSSNEIKLSAQKPKEKDDEETLDEALANAKSKVLSKISKKNNIENMIPVIIELKHYLEDHRSPLLKNLMAFLCSLVKDFRVEMEDLMSGDKQLANEIEFDIRQFEKLKTPVAPKVQPRTASNLERFALAQSPFKSPRVLPSASKQPVAPSLLDSAKKIPQPLFKTPSKVVRSGSGIASTPKTLNLSMISPVVGKSTEKSFQVIHMNTPDISPSLASDGKGGFINREFSLFSFLFFFFFLSFFLSSCLRFVQPGLLDFSLFMNFSQAINSRSQLPPPKHRPSVSKLS